MVSGVWSRGGGWGCGRSEKTEAPAPTTFPSPLFSRYTADKARRAAATALATDLASDAVDSLRKSLAAADADGDGRVSVDDLRDALRRAGSTATAKLVAKLLAGSNGIEYDTLLGQTRRMASIAPQAAQAAVAA